MDYLLIDILKGLVYAVVFGLIVVILTLAFTAEEEEPAETTEDANRIVFSMHGPEQEAEEIIERLLV